MANILLSALSQQNKQSTCVLTFHSLSFQIPGLSSDRLGILEQALPLAEHFHETHGGLSSWMNDMERQVSHLALPALRPDLIAQQQDKNEVSGVVFKLDEWI